MKSDISVCRAYRHAAYGRFTARRCLPAGLFAGLHHCVRPRRFLCSCMYIYAKSPFCRFAAGIPLCSVWIPFALRFAAKRSTRDTPVGCGGYPVAECWQIGRLRIMNLSFFKVFMVVLYLVLHKYAVGKPMSRV